MKKYFLQVYLRQNWNGHFIWMSDSQKSHRSFKSLEFLEHEFRHTMENWKKKNQTIDETIKTTKIVFFKKKKDRLKKQGPVGWKSKLTFSRSKKVK